MRVVVAEAAVTVVVVVVVAVKHLMFLLKYESLIIISLKE